ncbi:hypothetical protein TVAG_323730 [Trichomonas vaginalis G3]|uniref:non-specific serine/threonine protein kinase n=1 Tax=Trichomonas vaginalis (strain ATCC PRA-98 / G3) TaxID=412133 RepID=A2FTW7_TRIV3|nr:hypothetical protein TVAG_323730 [Trichomonas vaginalis G3]|eukprot:XP_001304587.1 hypothetical protein [Trichomonas vaginalis G3]
MTSIHASSSTTLKIQKIITCNGIRRKRKPLDYVNENGRLNDEQARKYFLQLISVLDYLHNKLHIAHRDLKAENILSR